MQAIHPQLEQAVKEEILYSQKLANENLKIAPNILRKQGLSLFPCEVRDIRTGINGEFYQLETSFVINNSFFRRGSSVLFYVDNKRYKARIVELNAYSLTIFSKEEIEGNPFENSARIDFTPDDRTLECMEFGVRFLKEQKQLQDFEHDFSVKKETSSFSADLLNNSQQEAVGAILSSDLTTVIQGPPGTGKTHTLSIAIAELVNRGKKVLVTAPSNTAVDNLCKKLIAAKISLLRVGNNEKVSAEVIPYTIDAYLEGGKTAQYSQTIKKQIQKTEQVANRTIRNYTKEAADEKRQAKRDLRELQKELRKLAQDTEQQLIESSSVIAGTPVALFNALSKDASFDVVILDEAGQSLAPLTWLVATFGKKLVLCGDPQQLPPVVFSNKAIELGLNKSLLETVSHLQKPVLLNEQYRMAPEIVSTINPYFYNNELQTAIGIPSGEIQFIDMAGFGNGETENETTGSFENWDEVKVVRKLIESESLNPTQTTIIAPYSAQIALLQKTMGTEWHVSTIDAIQGQEEENIVISFTRSNPDGIIGFLRDYRRTNVAISRAKRKCYLIGDSATLGNDSFYSQLIHEIETNGVYRSAWEFE
ncbi:AAA domain-containing protein [Fluviicola taffensis]|uniref:DEAD-like helicase n=1 Tax=Fluviicola taffensis (strain DSM 16823 / NCIMB 13979 / RW262) TaxID=755732 RepID=F2IEP2_FLUTR|nr:AAA domain-containing protein [Fluviicola taffensis]AEA44581.1 DEAD-like helicase [Fluviicola taffensis DSM 16823]